ncbi:hypothetical protein HAX54_012503 [Datura stramonium]|uniref:Chlorophyll a-b binding protein, chloroplastic n=1 Tax=Datura stramonium TaxID=4076 RepID=A0ABS8TJW0_DATST|nr:hypothetical protein [Datura stramonium]
MDIAVGRGFQVLAFSGSFFHGKSICKTCVAVKGIKRTARTGHSLRPCRTVIQAQQRPTWLPGLDPPPHLDGTLAGDFGFDPLGIGEDPESLRWYPSGPLLNPLGIAKDIKNAKHWKLKQIKNAMVAMLGIFVQASVTHVGPIDNLIEHLSNPCHKTILQTIAASSS